MLWLGGCPLKPLCFELIFIFFDVKAPQQEGAFFFDLNNDIQ